MTHGIIDYAIPIPGEPDMRLEAFLSPFCNAEQLWNVTAAAGKKTLVFHWPGVHGLQAVTVKICTLWTGLLLVLWGIRHINGTMRE